MKITIVFCIIFLSIACSRNTSQQIESSSQPVVEISSTTNDVVERNPTPAYIEIKTDDPWVYPTNNSNEKNPKK